MKNFTLPLLTLVLSFSFSYTNAQCPPGDMQLNSQPEVNAFIADYPNCTQINGSLRIGSIAFGAYSNIDDLSGLGGINTITGDLLIVNNNSLINIHGFDELSHVGGNLHIYYNQNLETLAGLNNLLTVDGSLRLLNNQTLATIDGVQNLVSVGEDMQISENTSLTDLNTFEKLATVGGYLSIWGNPVLNDINEFAKLGTVGGNLAINQNDLITNLQGFQSLVAIGGDFTITMNQSLTEIGNLNPLISPSATLRIANNFNLSGCAVQVFCDHISNGGSTEIIGNSPGCESAAAIENSCAMTLPVELSDFSAVVKNKNVLLAWRTLTENNNEGFEIQRSNDGLDWEAIGWQAGKGDATSTQTYTFTDSRPILGKSYYRLAQTDFDGKIEHSQIVIVSFYNGVVSVYPNPVRDMLTITVADDMPIESIVVYNTSGSEALRETTVTSNLNVARLNSGTYIIAIQVGGETIRQKLVVE